MYHIDLEEQIESILLPHMTNYYVLPSIMVAEIIQFNVSEILPQTPSWIFGKILWKNKEVYLIIHDLLKETHIKYIAICHVAVTGSSIKYFGLLTTGIPKPVKIRRQDMASIENGLKIQRGTFAYYTGKMVIIPDVVEIVAHLKNEYLS